MIQRYVITATTDSTGAATAYVEGTQSVYGQIESIRYVKDATSPYDSGVDFTFTLEESGRSVLAVTNVSASTTWYPRATTCDGSGGALTDYDKIAVPNEKLKLVIAQGTASKTGTFYITVITA